MYVRAASLGSVLLAGSAFLGANSQIDDMVPTVAPAWAYAPTIVRPDDSSAPQVTSPIAPRQQTFVYQVESAGVVEVRRVTGGLAFGDVTPAAGWTWEPDEVGASLSGTFSNGTTTLLFIVVDKDGSPQAMAMEVGSNDVAPTPTTQKRPSVRSTSAPTTPPATSPTTSPPSPPAPAEAAPKPVAEPVVVVAAPTTSTTSTTRPTPTTQPATERKTTASPVTTEKPRADREDKKRDDKNDDRDDKKRDDKKRDDKNDDRDDDRDDKNDDRDDKKNDDKKRDDKNDDDKNDDRDD